MLIVTGQVLSVDKQIMIFIKLPKLAVYHIEMFVAEEVCNLVDIVLVLQQFQCWQELGSSQLRDCYLPAPGPVDFVEYPGYHSVDVAGVELGGLLQEQQPGVGVDHVLDEGDEILRDEVVPGALGEEGHKLGGVVVTGEKESAPGLGELQQSHSLRLVSPGRDEDGTFPVERVARHLETGRQGMLLRLN